MCTLVDLRELSIEKNHISAITNIKYLKSKFKTRCKFSIKLFVENIYEMLGPHQGPFI